MPPFLKKRKNKALLKLHKDLYPAELLDKIKNLDTSSIVSTVEHNSYFLVELNIDVEEDYLDFLNYLIYHKIDR